jgi:hypothetical protein
MKKCPFRKRIYVDNTTSAWKDTTIITEQHEEFEDCIGKECMAYTTNSIVIPATGGRMMDVSICSLCVK